MPATKAIHELSAIFRFVVANKIMVVALCAEPNEADGAQGHGRQEPYSITVPIRT